MAHHYHLVTQLDQREHGGTIRDHYFGPSLPLEDARTGAVGLAGERGLSQIAGGVWTDAPDADAFNDDWVATYQYIYIDPCDNEIDFDIPWNAYRDENHEFRRAPKGRPCPSLIKKEYKNFFFKNQNA